MDCWFVEDRFYIDSKIQREDITPPTLAEMLFMSPSEKQNMDMLDLKCSTPREEQRSRFVGYCGSVHSKEEVHLAYMKVKKLEQRADHIMLGYRIKDAEVVSEGSVSNGEHFGDLEVMKVLHFQERVNVVLLVA